VGPVSTGSVAICLSHPQMFNSAGAFGSHR
jgi:hypothetical protein